MSVGVSVFRKIRFGGRVGVQLSYLMYVESVECGMLMVTVRTTVALMVSIK